MTKRISLKPNEYECLMIEAEKIINETRTERDSYKQQAKDWEIECTRAQLSESALLAAAKDALRCLEKIGEGKNPLLYKPTRNALFAAIQKAENLSRPALVGLREERRNE